MLDPACGRRRFFLALAAHQSRIHRQLLAAGGKEGPRSTSRRKRKERHLATPILGTTSFAMNSISSALDYIHYNLSNTATSNVRAIGLIHRSPLVERGVYESNWGCAEKGDLKFVTSMKPQWVNVE